MRIVLRILGGLLLVVLLLVAADALRWRHRTSLGDGFEQVEVSRVTIASLKNKKEEYTFDGDDMVTCARSVLPMPAGEGWYTPCWWLRKHRTVEARY